MGISDPDNETRDRDGADGGACDGGDDGGNQAVRSVAYDLNRPAIAHGIVRWSRE